jgi:hypothetical protein
MGNTALGSVRARQNNLSSKWPVCTAERPSRQAKKTLTEAKASFVLELATQLMPDWEKLLHVLFSENFFTAKLRASKEARCIFALKSAWDKTTGATANPAGGVAATTIPLAMFLPRAQDTLEEKTPDRMFWNTSWLQRQSSDACSLTLKPFITSTKSATITGVKTSIFSPAAQNTAVIIAILKTTTATQLL